MIMVEVAPLVARKFQESHLLAVVVCTGCEPPVQRIMPVGVEVQVIAPTVPESGLQTVMVSAKQG